MIKKHVTNSPYTTIIGIIVALFALAAMWFGKVNFWEALTMILAGCFLVVAKDVWIKNIFTSLTIRK